MTTVSLPKPSEVELEHSLHLQQIIAERIRQSAAISFAEFMQMALYEPGYGYYMSNLQKLGEQGDFVTAPEISSLFSYCIAHYLRNVFEQLDVKDVLEFGAGRGVMAADILTRLWQLDSLPEHYYIVELSADLKQQQQERLSECGKEIFQRVVWLDSLEDFKMQGVVLGNELLDAMPVSLFKRYATGNTELYVELADENLFRYVERSANDAVNEWIRAIEADVKQDLPDGYMSEINFNLRPWAQTLNEVLEKGLVLLFDYGYPRSEYYLPERITGTLSCYYRQHVHYDALLNIGLQDITSHVDFTAVAEAMDISGFALQGFTTQAYFLMSQGLDEAFNGLLAIGEDELQLVQAVKRLTLPSEMGEKVKVIGFEKQVTTSELHFSQVDYSHRL